MDDFHQLKECQASGMFDDSEFRSFSPERLRSFIDRDNKDRIGADSMAEVENSTLAVSISKLNDFSTMGDYFKKRSSYPFSDDGDTTKLEDVLHDILVPDKSHSSFNRDTKEKMYLNVDAPTVIIKDNTKAYFRRKSPRKSIQDHSLDSSREVKENLGLSINNSPASVSQLASFFADPDKSPLSSGDIMDHVLKYCRHIGDNDGRKSREAVEQIEEKRRRTSIQSENFNDISKNYRRSLPTEGLRRDSGYSAFSQAAAVHNLFPSRCSTPENTSPTLAKSSVTPRKGSVCKPFASTTSNILVSRTTIEGHQNLHRNSMSRKSRECINPKPNTGVQLQLHIPQSTVPLNSQLPGPIIININCPNAPNPPPSRSRGLSMEEEPGSNSRSALESSSRAGNSAISQRRPSAAQPSKIHIQLSGTIEWS